MVLDHLKENYELLMKDFQNIILYFLVHLFDL